MRQLFNVNPFGRLLAAEDVASIAGGINGNIHHAFEFEPGCGASLFARHLAAQAGGDRLLFHADLGMVTGDEHLAKMLARLFVQTFAGDLGRIDGVLKKLIPTATPRLVMDDHPHVDIDYGTEPRKLFANLVDLPEVMGAKEGRGATVIWTGFGRIGEILGDEGPRLFVEKVRGQRVACHVLIGYGVARAAQTLADALPGRVRILDGAALVPQRALEPFLAAEFAAVGLPLGNESAAAIARLAEGKLETALTAARAYACHCATMPADEALECAVDDILAGAASAHEQVWELLNPRQRGVLYGLTRGGETSIYSEQFIKEYGFKTATNLQAAIRALDAKGILHKRGKRWMFSDPFFALWIQRHSR